MSAVLLKQNALSSRSSKGPSSRVLSFPLNKGIGIGLAKSDFLGFFMVLVKWLVERQCVESEEEYFLLLAGATSAGLSGKLKQLLGSIPNAHQQLRHLSESEVLSFYAMSDALIFPGENYFNSGTIYTALSLNVPVITAESIATLE